MGTVGAVEHPGEVDPGKQPGVVKGGGGRGGRVVTTIGRLVVVGHLGSLEPGKQTTGVTGGARVVDGGGGHPG